ncbi:MAG: hypothetical protein WC307_05135 [Candidatus Nanoarchaeia archaeon]
MTYCSSCNKDLSVCYNCIKELSSQFVCVYLNQFFEGNALHFCCLECYNMFVKGLLEPVIINR